MNMVTWQDTWLWSFQFALALPLCRRQDWDCIFLSTLRPEQRTENWAENFPTLNKVRLCTKVTAYKGTLEQKLKLKTTFSLGSATALKTKLGLKIFFALTLNGFPARRKEISICIPPLNLKPINNKDKLENIGKPKENAIHGQDISNPDVGLLS